MATPALADDEAALNVAGRGMESLDALVASPLAATAAALTASFNPLVAPLVLPSAFRALRRLDISHCALSALAPIAEAAPRLQVLRASGNALSDLSFLAGCASLLEVWLDRNEFASLRDAARALSGAPLLRVATLHGNPFVRAGDVLARRAQRARMGWGGSLSSRESSAAAAAAAPSEAESDDPVAAFLLHACFNLRRLVLRDEPLAAPARLKRGASWKEGSADDGGAASGGAAALPPPPSPFHAEILTVAADAVARASAWYVHSGEAFADAVESAAADGLGREGGGESASEGEGGGEAGADGSGSEAGDPSSPPPPSPRLALASSLRERDAASAPPFRGGEESGARWRAGTGVSAGGEALGLPPLRAPSGAPPRSTSTGRGGMGSAGSGSASGSGVAGARGIAGGATPRGGPISSPSATARRASGGGAAAAAPADAPAAPESGTDALAAAAAARARIGSILASLADSLPDLSAMAARAGVKEVGASSRAGSRAASRGRAPADGRAAEAPARTSSLAALRADAADEGIAGEGASAAPLPASDGAPAVAAAEGEGSGGAPGAAAPAAAAPAPLPAPARDAPTVSETPRIPSELSALAAAVAALPGLRGRSESRGRAGADEAPPAPAAPPAPPRAPISRALVFALREDGSLRVLDSSTQPSPPPMGPGGTFALRWPNGALALEIAPADGSPILPPSSSSSSSAAAPPPGPRALRVTAMPREATGRSRTLAVSWSPAGGGTVSGAGGTSLALALDDGAGSHMDARGRLVRRWDASGRVVFTAPG
jgi:hypothetical protein